MKELGITKGEWKYRDHFSDGIIETEETIIGHLMKWGSPEDELQANAALIIDAGNTAQKCGLLPSELLRQRDELREALQYLMEGVRGLPPLTAIQGHGCCKFSTYQPLLPRQLTAIVGVLEKQYKQAEAAIKNTDG